MLDLLALRRLVDEEARLRRLAYGPESPPPSRVSEKADAVGAYIVARNNLRDVAVKVLPVLIEEVAAHRADLLDKGGRDEA